MRADRRVGGRRRGAPAGRSAAGRAHDRGANRGSRGSSHRDHGGGTLVARAGGRARDRDGSLEARHVIVVAIETSTPQVSVAIGTEQEILGRIQVAGRARQESVAPALERLLGWTGVDLGQVGGVAVGIGPGLFTGLRVGVQTAKTLAQVTRAMILGFTSLDALAYPVRFTSRRILAVVDGRRGEVFSAIYSAVPGGVMRGSEYAISTPDHLAADLEALPGDVLAVGDGAILYRDVLTEQRGGGLEIASPAFAHPDAASLVELAAPRFLREEHDRLFDVAPLYLRKSDAEIAWDRRTGDP
ncbi:MAG: tRNA (adenosine(37)-N6)-threonylcarbamoyltransferase complex dimerization subunit type 1 TsaB [Actinobacteria bacterium]|nr:MAG: tRNA (adenosine(37)-N6)-threonylcarbamoyltransferase complex dimerization subunit type 1 TsaB [Actinomycetota bacterium]